MKGGCGAQPGVGECLPESECLYVLWPRHLACHTLVQALAGAEPDRGLPMARSSCPQP